MTTAKDQTVSLNPCFNGRYSQSAVAYEVTEEIIQS